MADTKAAIELIKSKLADREWRIDNLYFIEDKFGNTIKFVRNESQRHFWNNMWYLNILLKDRQRGFSTLIAIFILDYCLFNSGTKAGIIDITMSDAEKKLGKIKFAYDRLPGFLKLTYPLKTKNTESIEWVNGSSVYIGISHRGGTLQILHLSEMGTVAIRFPERAREIRTGALNTVAPGNFVFNESTAVGNSGEFYDDCKVSQELRDSKAPLTKLDYKFHFFAWWMGEENEIEPEGVFISLENEKYFKRLEEETGIQLSARKKAWYAKKEAQQKDDMKREYPGTPEEAFEAAIEGAYLSSIITKMTKDGQITVVPMEPGVPINTGWDFGISDHMTIWLHQRVAMQDRIIGYMSGTDSDVTYYWAELRNNYQCIWGSHFLPHDASARRIGTSTDPASPPRTLEQILQAAGMHGIKIVPRVENKATAIQEVKLFLPKVWIDKQKCEKGIDCLKNFKREWDDKNGCWKNSPR
ncbi:MAG TPA: hypothetical protein DCS09_09785, partial [Porphyromonadaceae bacterium]|nr:hypothetical protein [Porphyromonadaceae bacterium]